ncbi:MAG TPA: hemerythrin domain-containing protein [Paludibacter sp.]|nr:hemerythrin domain-containing protein [Paludibacter sp.]
MNAIDILVKEHDSILKMIEITQTILNSKDETNIHLNHIEKIIDFIQNFADKYHHLKEEDVLFMEMEKHGMPREGGPIGVMLHEHDEGRAYIKAAVEGIAKLKAGENSAFTQIKVNLLNYCELLSNHIYKENNILYPMAQRFLPSEILDGMTVDFKEANLSTPNNEYSDKYLVLVNELSIIYLK